MPPILPIKVDATRLLFSVAYLGSPIAEVWIGPNPEGPKDDDDALVLERRRNAEADWKSGKTKRPSGISAFTIRDTDGDGYYELDTAGWEPGLYRLNVHGPANEPTPHGQPLNPTKRDLEYSWPMAPDEVRDQADVKPYIYWEPNGRGWGYRIEVRPDGSIGPAGNA